jgi:hypothetical protein
LSWRNYRGCLAPKIVCRLRTRDGNDDDVINANDAVFADLRVWVDANRNGITDAGELRTLAQAGVASISLASTSGNAVDHGNLLGLTGSFVSANGARRQLADVWFDSRIPAAVTAQSTTDADEDSANVLIKRLDGKDEKARRQQQAARRFVTRMLEQTRPQHSFEVRQSSVPAASTGDAAHSSDDGWLRALERSAGKTLKELA